MKLVYGGDLFEHGSCYLRLETMRRLGFEVHPFDFAPYRYAGGPLRQRLRLRLLWGSVVTAQNRDLLALCTRLRPDFVWLDKPLFVYPETVRALRRLGATVIQYNSDNPYGTLFQPWFRHIRRAIADYDINIVPRPSSVEDFTAAGARQVILMPFAFDPLIHFPRPAAEAGVFARPLSFTGTPYGQRAAFLRTLAAADLPLSIRGERWGRVLPRRLPHITFGPPAWGDEYRRALQESALCLSFVTHENHDPYAHKSFEITACASLLLAERTPGHAALFEEDREAAFFGSVAEAGDKARFYLARPDCRVAVARAGCRRAWTAGYSNDERIAAAFGDIDGRLGRVLKARARGVIDRRRGELGL